MKLRASILAALSVCACLVLACYTPVSEDETPIPAQTAPTPSPPPPAASLVAPAGTSEARSNHTATLMPDDTILAVAGAGADDGPDDRRVS